MNIRVQTKSGAFEFECDAGEPLLYAGLRHGIALPYECATGTCGTCRARVHEGEARLLWDEAPGLSYVKREKNEVLMCQAASETCTLRVPAQVTQNGAAHLTPAHRQATLGAIRHLTHDVLEFEVETQDAMAFDPGQFVVLTSDAVIGGRAYSMVNFAADERRLVFVIKRKPGGAISDWIFETAASGMPVKLFGPLGRATFRPAEDENILCIAGGSGIAGMMSITRFAAQTGHFQKNRGSVFFGVRTGEDVFYLEELSALAARFPENLAVTVALSDAEPSVTLQQAYPQIRFETGFVHTVVSANIAGLTENVTGFVAGPPPMVDGALRMLVVEAQVPPNKIRYDKFG